ncbi:putative nuclease HARBI1 [Tetranychus urticae]|uniref:putative nuclease HARBI1 n=1 Tax=Tetranychus urticae TaxID=32264 RepID=UPI000D656537|nr:putative nuclease HARBI1 [Tetranychus urticae]
MDEYLFAFGFRQRRNPQRRTILPKNDLLVLFDDFEFKKRFRMNKETFHVLLDLIKDEIEIFGKRNHPVSPENQLLIALRFFATGSFQIVSGDLIGFSQPTISRIVLKVSTVLARKLPQFIVFPSPTEEAKLHSGFSKIAGFPGVIGVVDGTHIKVKVPKDLHERFRNRKNEITVNCQVVFDHNMKFLHINARWPGSTHDSRIFKHSEPYYVLESQSYTGHLLGDSAYPCKTYLMTPLSDPNTLAEMIYQKKHIKTRNLVERSIGAWKRRFYCLNDLRLKFTTSLTVILATAVLWNFLIIEKDEFVEEDTDIDENPIVHREAERIEQGTQAGFDKRRLIINQFEPRSASVLSTSTE